MALWDIVRDWIVIRVKVLTLSWTSSQPFCCIIGEAFISEQEVTSNPVDQSIVQKYVTDLNAYLQAFQEPKYLARWQKRVQFLFLQPYVIFISVWDIACTYHHRRSRHTHPRHFQAVLDSSLHPQHRCHPRTCLGSSRPTLWTPTEDRRRRLWLTGALTDRELPLKEVLILWGAYGSSCTRICSGEAKIEGFESSSIE